MRRLGREAAIRTAEDRIAALRGQPAARTWTATLRILRTMTVN
jgi:hypothetical protein